VRAPTGEELTNEHVAAAIRAQGTKISQSYIWQLRKGQKDNPTLRHVQALAAFWGVPAGYFFEDQVTDQVNEELGALQDERRRLAKLRGSSEVQVMAMRAGELSTEGRKQVLDLLDVIYRLEQSEHGNQPNG
jgi:transcriptional regulator with XRE-family HTH domain